MVVKLFKITIGTNNYNTCMTKHTLSCNLNICSRSYLKLTEVNALGTLDTIMMH